MLVPRVGPGRRVTAFVVAVGALPLGAASSSLAATSATSAAGGPVATTGSGSLLHVRVIGVRGGRIGVRAWTTRGTEHDVSFIARRGHQVLASGRLSTVSPRRRTVELTVRRGVSTSGRFTVTASAQAPLGQTTSKTSS